MILQFTVIRCWWLCSNQWTGWYRYSIKPLNPCVDLSKLYRSTLSSECQIETMAYILLITLILTKLFSMAMAFPFQNGRMEVPQNLLGKCLAYYIVSRYFLIKPDNFIKIVTADEHSILPYALANCIKVYKCLYLS